MYRSFFGLNKLPFKISPDLSFFYKHASREDIADALFYSIERGDGIIKVVGEVGVGKTTLLRLVADRLPPHYQKIYVSSPNLSPIDFLKFICSELQVFAGEHASKLDLVKSLNEYLIEEHRNNRRVVMLIDESQSMTLDTLEEVRLLGNLETQDDKLLQIVLFGQPELDVTLKDTRIKPLKDRIACNVNIPSLNPEEVMRYLNYRMRIAGYMGSDVFSLKVAKRICKISGGLPRSINLLADKLLMIAFSASDHEIKMKHFKMVDDQLAWYDRPALHWAMSALIVLALSLAVWFQWGQAGSEIDAHSRMALKQDSESVQPNESAQKAEDKVVEVNPSFISPVEMSKRLGVSFEKLHDLVELQERTQHFLAEQKADTPMILMEASQLSEFDRVHQDLVSGLSAVNRQYVFSVFEVDFRQDRYRYQLLYYPRTSLGKRLASKQQDLQTLTNGMTSKIVSASEVRAMMNRLKEQGNVL